MMALKKTPMCSFPRVITTNWGLIVAKTEIRNNISGTIARHEVTALW